MIIVVVKTSVLILLANFIKHISDVILKQMISQALTLCLQWFNCKHISTANLKMSAHGKCYNKHSDRLLNLLNS